MTTLFCDQVYSTGERIQRRVRRNLEHRHAMTLNELCIRLAMPRQRLRAEIDKMILRGEVERLRPIGMTGDDYDAYRLVRFDIGLNA